MNALFHLGDILSVTTDRLLSPDRIGGVYRLLNHMTGDNLMTHQLPRASDECRPYLLAQFPELADVVVPEFPDEAAVWRWLDGQVTQRGAYFTVQPLASGCHTVIDPLAELAMNYPHLQVIPVEVPEGGDPR